MEAKFIYKGMDLTLDYYEKVRKVVESIADQEKKDFDECYEIFAGSQTYEALREPESLMWSESIGFIVDEFYRENKGRKLMKA